MLFLMLLLSVMSASVLLMIHVVLMFHITYTVQSFALLADCSEKIYTIIGHDRGSLSSQKKPENVDLTVQSFHEKHAESVSTCA